MRTFKSAVAVLVLGIALSGCAAFQKFQADLASLTGATINPAAVAVAVNLFDSAEATATNYLTLVKCTGANGPICRSPTITAQIIPAIRSGRIARTNLENFLQGHPSALGVSGDYAAITTAINTLQSILANYPTK